MSATHYTYDLPDGGQALVIIWPDAPPHVAVRSGRSGSWGPPLEPVTVEVAGPVARMESCAALVADLLDEMDGAA